MKQNKIRILYRRIIPFILALLIYDCNKDDVSLPVEIK